MQFKASKKDRARKATQYQSTNDFMLLILVLPYKAYSMSLIDELNAFKSSEHCSPG